MNNIKVEFKELNDSNIWNSFVKSLSRYTFVQSYEYTKVITALVKDIKRVGVFMDNEIIALLPIGIINARRGKYIRLRHGPVLSEKALNPEIFNEIIKYLEEFAISHGAAFIRLQPIIPDSNILSNAGFTPAPTHNLDAEHTLQLNLVAFDHNDKQVVKDRMMANMRKNTRYYIRKAFKEGIEVVKANDRFEKFYEILKATAQRQEYTTWPKKYFENLFTYFKNGDLNLYFAEYKGKEIGIGLFLDFGKYRFYLEGGMDMEYSRYYPAYAIQWTSICDAIDKGVQVYDFWGGVAPKDKNGEPVKDYPWSGINLFKAGFGGEEVSMVHPFDKKISNRYWVTWLIERIEKWRRGY